MPLYGKVLEQAKGFSGTCKVVSTEDLGLYGLVEAGDRVLLGPVFSQPVTEKMVSAFARQNGIGNRDWSVLYWLLAGIPRYAYNQFSNLLRYTDMSLSEIAGALGFSSQAYFQSFFKKAAGLTPMEFRRVK